MSTAILRKLTLALVLSALLLVDAGAVSAAEGGNSGYWAQTAIDTLRKQGLLDFHPGRSFKADQTITRAEFASLAVKAFHLPRVTPSPFSDTAKHWARLDIGALVKAKVIDGRKDEAFGPDQPAARAEVVSMLGKLMQFGSKEQVFGMDWPQTYPDVAPSHPAFRLIELAGKLGYLPPAYGGIFLPDASVTQAEAVWMIAAIQKLKYKGGNVIEVNPELNSLTINQIDGAGLLTIKIDPQAIVLRNNSEVLPDKIQVNDQVKMMLGPDGLAHAVKATGKVTANDLMSRLNGLSKGILNAQTVASIAMGDWTAAGEASMNMIFDRLLGMGVSPGEAQSLIDRDWLTLDLLSRDKISTQLSSRLNVSPEITQALMDGNLSNLKNLLQSQLTSTALGRLLQTQS